MFKRKKTWFPKKILWRLTIPNMVVISIFIALSSIATYNTACYLADDIGTVQLENQVIFDTTLFQYILIFSISAIVASSLVHFYVTKKLINPLQELINSTIRMKKGDYPTPLSSSSTDEIGQLTTHFNDLVQQLKTNQENRKKLVSDISHELRTPLANLNGYMSALKNGVITGDKKLYESLHGELNQITQMVNQLDQLKEWDDIKNQKFTEKETFQLNKLVQQTVEMFRWNLNEKEILCEVSMDTGKVHASKKDIAQIFSNFLDNAIRYYNGSEPIVIKGESRQTEYLVEVTGPGERIEKSDHPYLFERFYRVDSSRGKDTGGTGLGLAISKEIIEHHGGQIGMFSTEQLHTFWFTLPTNQ